MCWSLMVGGWGGKLGKESSSMGTSDGRYWMGKLHHDILLSCFKATTRTIAVFKCAYKPKTSTVTSTPLPKYGGSFIQPQPTRCHPTRDLVVSSGRLHDTFHPRIDSRVGQGISHVQSTGEEASFLGRAIFHQHHGIFDGHETILGTLH